MIILNLTLSKEDLFQFSYYTGWTAKWNIKKRINFYLKFIFYYVVVVALFLYFRKENPSWPFAVIFLIVPLFFSVILLPAWIKYRYRNQVETFYDDPKNASFFLPTEFCIDEKGIHTTDSISSTTHSWSAFVRKTETNQYFYLYLNTLLGIVVPQTSFKSQSEKEEFKNLLLTHLPLQAEFENLT